MRMRASGRLSFAECSATSPGSARTARSRSRVLRALGFVCGSIVGFVGFVALFAPVEARAQDPAPHVVVETDRDLGATRNALLGVGWNTGDIERIAPLRPSIVRIDSRLESTVPAPGVFMLDGVLEKIRRVRRVGGEPMVILFGMPAWLGAPRAATCEPDTLFFPDGCDPEKVAPSDLAVWEDLIAEVVRRLATAPRPAYLFEVWNEPDIGVFWHDTREAFFDTAAATHRAIESVREETGLPLGVGGPAAVTSANVAAYVENIARRGLPLHFVSWHWYANNPFLGPDGAEGNIDPALYEALRGINPEMTPSIYGEQAREVRRAIEPVLRDAGLDPDLLIDEWNISAGGLDRRHDSNEGAAFAAASLIEMERAGLDGAALYRSNSDREEPGDWGMIGPDGRKKPVWSVFEAFQRARGRLLEVSGDDPSGGLWARASRHDDQVDVFLVTFRALADSGRTVTVELRGGCAPKRAHVAALDATTPAFRAGRTVHAAGGAFTLELPEQSVTRLELDCPATATTSGCVPRRSAGGDPGPPSGCPRLRTR